MSKKYFAKWILVEGEIKEGDKVKHNGRIVTALEKEGEGDTWKTDGFPIYGSNVAKGKLFLCSRDIQVGDKVWCNGSEDIVVEYPFTDPYGDGYDIVLKEAGTQTASSILKVVGEISPDALGYVKEGDEFNEDEVRKVVALECYYQSREVQYEYEDRFIPVTQDYIPKANEAVLDTLIEVKGPCGHFH